MGVVGVMNCGVYDEVKLEDVVGFEWYGIYQVPY